MTDSTYNGFANYETWNVALWINNDENFYEMARHAATYGDFVDVVSFDCTSTPDMVSWTDSCLDIDKLDEMLDELDNGYTPDTY